jgi:HK97 gp10 family phage protein
MEFEIEVKGLAELEDILNNKAPKAAIQTLRNIEKQAGRVFQEAAEQTAPYDPSMPEPHLKDNIKIASKVTGDGELTVRVGPGNKTFWGMFQEFGTATEPAQHWLQRAFDQSLDQAVTAIEAAIARIGDLMRK